MCIIIVIIVQFHNIILYNIFGGHSSKWQSISDINILLNNIKVGTYYNILSNILYYYDTTTEYHAHTHTHTTTQALITVMPMGRFFILYYIM